MSGLLWPMFLSSTCTRSFLIVKTSPSRLPKYFYRTKIKISALFLTPSFWNQPHLWLPSVHTSRRYQNFADRLLHPKREKNWLVSKDWTVSSGYVSVELIIPKHNDKYHHQQEKHIEYSPGWCSSMDWVLAFEPKGGWFDSQSEHMLGLQARFPLWGMEEATTHWCFSPSLCPSLPLSLKINK